MKKHLWLAGLVMLAAALPALAGAAELKAGKDYYLNAGQTIAEDLYVGSGNVSVAGEVKGDLAAGGGNVAVTGKVTGDLMVGGGNVTVMGQIGDDLRVGGGTVIVGGKVAGDMIILGGDLKILPGAEIGGDLIAAGGMVNIEGAVKGDLKVWGGEVRMNSAVTGKAEVKADKVTVGSAAALGGLTYSAAQEATIEDGAKITGTPNFTKVERKHEEKRVWLGLGFWAIMKFLMFLAAALVFGLGFKRMSGAVLTSGVSNYWTNVFWGLVMLVVTPVAGVILAVTGVGLALAVMLLLSYILMILMGSVFAMFILGGVIYKMAKKGVAVSWHLILVGAVALFALTIIPVIGWIAQFLFFLAALGTLGRLWTTRVKREENTI